MLGSSPALPGGEVLNGVFALSVFIAGALLIALAVAAWHAFRYAGGPGVKGYLWRGALVLIGAGLALTLFDRTLLREQAAERRALDARAADLAARAIAPGSALACLNAMATPAVESACEKALFATPEGLAAAVAYVDAKFSLLAASSEYAVRDRSFEQAVSGLRRALEADRFGLVAQMLAARGCNAADCAELKLLRDTRRVLANMRERTFDAVVAAHVQAWPQARGPAAPASAGATSLPPGFVTRVPSATVGIAPGVPMGSRYDFPSAASIPPVSIMDAEPTLPPEREPQASAPPATRPSAAPPVRRQSTAREPPVAPPLQVVPLPGAPTTGQAPAPR
ncbi:MAG: hypothetical protein FJX62_20000 [Alphaproteobacteria bacterium]|nr:hypothetical protein [Alphaproteobacteria bacterium]